MWIRSTHRHAHTHTLVHFQTWDLSITVAWSTADVFGHREAQSAERRPHECAFWNHCNPKNVNCVSIFPSGCAAFEEKGNSVSVQVKLLLPVALKALNDPDKWLSCFKWGFFDWKQLLSSQRCGLNLQGVPLNQTLKTLADPQTPLTSKPHRKTFSLFSTLLPSVFPITAHPSRPQKSYTHASSDCFWKNYCM